MKNTWQREEEAQGRKKEGRRRLDACRYEVAVVCVVVAAPISCENNIPSQHPRDTHTSKHAISCGALESRKARLEPCRTVERKANR